jgi:hypothetical protein
MRPALIEWPTLMYTEEETRACPALARLGEAAEIGLAVDEDGPADAGSRVCATSTPSQPRRSPGVDTMPVRGSMGAGSARPDRQDVAHRAAERLHHVAEQDGEAVEFGVMPVIERKAGARSA